MKSETKNCQNCKNDFTIEPDDFSFYEKIKVPPPTFCPECRLIRRLIFRNDRVWHHRKCDATGKSILSIYSPDMKVKVYDQEYWKSDKWDSMDYGRDYNFDQSFFEQFKELFESVPHPNLAQKNNINSEYTNNTLNYKNCYFCASGDYAEDCAYLFGSIIRAKNCLDLHQSNDCEFCYELTDCLKSNLLFFGQNCEECIDSILLYDCKNCMNCFGCVGLRNKQYCIFNKQYFKEEYKEKIKEYWNGSYVLFLKNQEEFKKLKLKVPRKFAVITKSINVSGDDIYESRNCKQSFSIRNNIENCKYCFRIHEGSKDGYDTFIAWNKAENFCETVSIYGQNIFFSAFIWSGFEIQYSYNCYDCNNIFGCIGLRNKSYCIFNKQYSKEEYKKILLKIIEKMKREKEYGEFFPSEISPFGYNETLAQDYFPKSEKEATESGYKWRDLENKNYQITFFSDKIPDNLNEIPDSIISEIIECEHKGTCDEQCATAFRLTDFELKFYKKYNIPIPRLCPFCRHFQRLKQKTPLKLWHRNCMCQNESHKHEGGANCSNEFETPYSPERPEIIYCESCYQKEVY